MVNLPLQNIDMLSETKSFRPVRESEMENTGKPTRTELDTQVCVNESEPNIHCTFVLPQGHSGIVIAYKKQLFSISSKFFWPLSAHSETNPLIQIT